MAKLAKHTTSNEFSYPGHGPHGSASEQLSLDFTVFTTRWKVPGVNRGTYISVAHGAEVASAGMIEPDRNQGEYSGQLAGIGYDAISEKGPCSSAGMCIPPGKRAI
ncbi:hypothetical protein FH972_021085 [Carpinus fangiana]|uniref:Uncharacterized protein n=1 Tax=Carpinus fangiana TaxID=176857 RepID=A0A5N6KNP3_9ROSI|nr:hypothetical protein FH972_021085 [Carpinus fangiana]